MNTADRRFRPDELAGGEGSEAGTSSAELAEVLATARELEAFARDADIRPSPDLTSRIMAAVAAEPLPAPVAAAGAAARAGRVGALLVAFRDTWRVAWSGGRPMALRVQAIAIVAVVLIAAGSVTTLATVGALNVLAPDRSPEPTPVASPSPSVPPSMSPEPSPSASPSPTPDESASGSPEASDSPEPSETPESSSGGTATPKPSAQPTARPTASPSDTPEPTRTPEPTETLKPGETPKPTGTDDHSGPGG